MIDRVSTFANPEIILLLKTKFETVAIDQWYQRRQKDAEGEFYRKIAGQGPRNNFKSTTQGLYVAAADGTFLGYTNNRTPSRVMAMLQKALKSHEPKTTKVIEPGKSDARYNPAPPKGGLVIRVRTKILRGYEKTKHHWNEVYRTALSRDNMWINKKEHLALVAGSVPASLQIRLARFHLVDSTRGEPPMWKQEDVRKIECSIKNGKLSGTAHLETKDGKRGYQCTLRGVVELKDGKITRFDVVAKGDFWGDGNYTRNAPEGKFPLAVAFSLADGTDVADAIPPTGSRGWLPDYIRD